MSATKYPLTNKIEETESQKLEMMKLIMEQIAQLKQMETEMEKMIKEKEKTTKTSIDPLEVVPLTTIPA